MNKIFTNKKILILIGVVIAIIIATYLFIKSSDGISVYYDIDSMPKTLDPQINTDKNGDMIIQNMFLGLTTLNKDGKVILGAAKEHSVSDDGLTHTFILNDDIFWSDENKTKVTAYDFEFAFRRLFSTNVDNKNVRNFSFIKNANNVLNKSLPVSEIGVKAIDSNKIVFNLEYNKSDFLETLLLPSAMPCNEGFFNSTNGAYGIGSKALITNGVYTLLSTDSKDYISINKNKNYIGNIKNDTNFIKFIFKSNHQDINSRFQNSTTSAIVSKTIDKATEKNSVYSNIDMYSLLFNSNDEVLKNKNIRLALTSSINIEELKNSMPKSLSPINTLLPPNIIIDDKKIYDYNSFSNNFYNINVAKSALNNAMAELNLKEIKSFNIIIPDNDLYFNVMSSITQMWQKELNIFANIKRVNDSEVLDNIKNNNFTIALVKSDNINDATSSINSFLTNYNIIVKSNINDKITIDDINNIYSNLSDSRIILPLFTQKKYFKTNVNGIIYHTNFDSVDFRYIRK